MKIFATVVVTLFLASSSPALHASPRTSTHRANFAGKDVRHCANIWFSSTVKAEGIAASGTRIYLRNSRIRFTADGTQYAVGGPNGMITFSADVKNPSTTFDPARNEYRTVVPVSFTGRVFQAGMLFFAPTEVGLKRRAGEAVWEAEFYSDTPGVTLTWQWEARAYWGGTASYQQITVEPTDASKICAGKQNNWWYGILCMPIEESKDKFLLVARSGAATVQPVHDIPGPAPMAVAQQVRGRYVGSLVELDGTHSHSASGEPLSFEWTFMSAPRGRPPALSGADTASPTFVPAEEGCYWLQLVVSAAGVRSAPSTVCVSSIGRVSDRWTFSLPGSVLLFTGYGEHRLVHPGRSDYIDASEWRMSVSSFSRDGNLLAWGERVPDESARVVPLEVSMHSREFYATPHRPAVVVYFVRERRRIAFPMGRPTVRYLDRFDWIKETAISPDGTRVAFHGCPEDCSKESGIYILEIATGKNSPPLITNIRRNFEKGRFTGGREVSHPSWSPDGKQIVLQLDKTVSVLDVESRQVRVLAEGRQPVWSPTGEWIAYFDEAGERVMLVRPDGTGQKTAKKLGGLFRGILAPWISFSDSPVWSPDGKKLLLNVYWGETLSLEQIYNVMLLDLDTGRMKRMRKRVLTISGWASQQAS
jgi:WD40 repeat protein